jgi:hypothetical protein
VFWFLQVMVSVLQVETLFFGVLHASPSRCYDYAGKSLTEADCSSHPSNTHDLLFDLFEQHLFFLNSLQALAL